MLDLDFLAHIAVGTAAGGFLFLATIIALDQIERRVFRP